MSNWTLRITLALLAQVSQGLRTGELPIEPRTCMSTTRTSSPSAAKFSASAAPHHPDAHGSSGRLQNPSSGPWRLRESLAWTWHHPQGRYYTFTNGVVIDGAKNLYLSAMDAIRKFTQDGELLWTYCNPSEPRLTMPIMISLSQGAVFGLTDDAVAFSLDMDTGKELWRRKVGNTVGGDQGNVMVQDGVAIVPTENCVDVYACDDNGNSGARILHGLNATDGSRLWEFSPDVAVWNFYALFPNDGTFAYQDLEGKVYRNRLADGTLIWKNGGIRGSWSDGCAGLGPYGLIYGVNQVGPNICRQGMCDSWLTAYNLTDGKVVWKTRRPSATNAFPAVGKAFGRPGLQVVVNSDSGHIDGHDALTGQMLWRFRATDGPGPERFKGDAAGYKIRSAVQPTRPAYVPNTWSNIQIGDDGTVYAGYTFGKFYALNDWNGDGQIDPQTEVLDFDADAAFPGTGPAIAPGMVAVASTDSLFVFKSQGDRLQ